MSIFVPQMVFLVEVSLDVVLAENHMKTRILQSGFEGARHVFLTI